jgi:hypothetical protein
MAQIKNLDVSELDFDNIKTNLITFLNNQSEFSDYNFEGSALSVLIDLLAYNTHYNAFLSNMLANEMFLDSAVKKSSGISISKHLGFTPASTRSARATINLVVNSPTGSPSTLTLPDRTAFSTTIDGIERTFFNLGSVTITPSAGIYAFNNLEIVEGLPKNVTFTSANPSPDEKFELSDPDIDTSTLLVQVQESNSDTTTATYNQTIDTSNVKSTSEVFFLEMNPTEKYEIFFGDDIIGKKLSSGNILKVKYLKSSGALVNTADTAAIQFTSSGIGGGSTSITTVSNPTGARNADNLVDIKFKAPRVNAARNRAVTAADYKSLIEANFTDAESVVVYGGEDNIPQKFGKVIISLKPFDGFTISQSTKDSIISSILANKKVMAIQPEFIDPEFIFVNLIVNVSFDNTATTSSKADVTSSITNTVDNYFATSLQNFNKDFQKSLLIKNIMDSDTSIRTVIILIKLQKRTNLTLGSVNTFTGDDLFDFQSKIQPGTVSSSRFFSLISNTTTLVNITDVPDTSPPDNNGTGTLVLRNSSTNEIVNNNKGNVNYSTGEVSISDITPTALPNNVTDFRITASVQEVDHNIKAQRNRILVRDKTLQNAAAGREAGLTVNVTETVD